MDRVLSAYRNFRHELGKDHPRIRVAMMAWYKSLPKNDPALAHKHYNHSDERGLYFADNFAGPDDGRDSRPRYEIHHPVTGKPCKKPSTGWRWEEETTKAALLENPPMLHFGPDETTIPCRKTYLEKVSEEPFSTVFYKDGRGATLTVESLLGKGAFEFPKDIETLSELFSMVTEPGDLILDSFAGSGSTGHAVISLNNQNPDTERRHFILVQIPYETEAQEKAGMNIARDKTRKRLERVTTGYTNAKGEAVAGLGGGFRYATLGEELFDAEGGIRREVSFEELARFVWFTATGEPYPHGTPVPYAPKLGVARDTAIYLLYNGVLDDLSPRGGNILTRDLLDKLPAHDGPKIVYAAGSRLSAEAHARAGILFRKTPTALLIPHA